MTSIRKFRKLFKMPDMVAPVRISIIYVTQRNKYDQGIVRMPIALLTSSPSLVSSI